MSFRKMLGGKKKGDKGEFEKKYRKGEKLGAGQFATVYLGELIADPKKKYAVKIISKDKLTTKEDIEGLDMEIKILKQVDHAGIIKLYDVYEYPSEWYLITELAEGGELFDKIVAKTKDSNYSEKEAALVVMQIAESLKYIHDRNIVHRDLKPENLLLESKADDSKIKLADFGFAAYCEKPLNDGCGTLVYVAPEILRGDDYQTSPDMWSLGVITYILLCGYPPFFDTRQEELSRKIVRGKYRFRSEDWDRVSNDAKDFIRGLLKRHPENRMTATDCLNHPWITNYAKLSNTGLDINKNLREFQAKMALKKAFLMIKAFNKLQERVKAFKFDPKDDDPTLTEGG